MLLVYFYALSSQKIGNRDRQKNMKSRGLVSVLICGLLTLPVTLISCGREEDNVPVEITFRPVITAMGAQRSGSEATFTATVSDAGPLSALTYSWGFDGGLTFVNNTTNPAVLHGYDETKSGNLTLIVANGSGGSSSISYYIAPGLLPDKVVVSLAHMTILPENTMLQPWPIGQR